MKNALLIGLLLVFVTGRSDEGMCLPFMLKKNYPAMQAAGLELSIKEIYNTKKPSIKDAIVSLGGFCTAEIISPRGLILTNHHCGFDAIRQMSTPEHDYLTDGFWAMKQSEELPIPGLTVSVVVEIIDVTKTVLASLNDQMDEDDRSLQVDRISRELAQDKTAGTLYAAEVKEFYEGSEYYLFVYEIFQDIRLVGAPPQAIGAYGGDTDNWMWTRHTGDFSMFRIYAGKENVSAPFAMDNQPYVPKHHLPISLSGVKENDFTMILGFPGSTDRYLTSHGVQMAVTTEQPTRVNIRAKKLEIIKNAMDQSDELRIRYASTYAQISNYWKYYIGQSEQLVRNVVFDKKQKVEGNFVEWIGEIPERKAKYGAVLTDLEEAYAVLSSVNLTTVYFSEAVFSISFTRFVNAHAVLLNEMKNEKATPESISAEVKKLKARYKGYFERIDVATEKRVISAMLEMLYLGVPKGQVPGILTEIAHDEAFTTWQIWVDSVLENSVFSDPERYTAFLENPELEKLENEQMLNLGIEMSAHYRAIAFSEQVNAAQRKLKTAMRLLIQAQREMSPEKIYYPDANFSLRLTYGNVLPYTTIDGKKYDYWTDIEGLMAKEDPNNPEFTVPSKLKELYEKKDYGCYGSNGSLRVNFLSNNDITGGNSGSPVINGRGELVGTAFDGNWEAMSGDIFFEDKLQRTISCDIRYILFIIDKYAGAGHLIEEMTLVE